MTGKRGRKGVYETHIQPYLEEISDMADEGATEAQMYKFLKISKDSFIKYKKEKTELSEALKGGRKKLIKRLRGKLIERASGYEYTEENRIEEDVLLDSGEKVTLVKVTRKTKHVPANVAALSLALSNYDETWANDPGAMRLKERELKLKEDAAKESSW